MVLGAWGLDDMSFCNFLKTYTHHLVDKSYATGSHHRINRMIGAWHDYTMHIIKIVDKSGAYPHNAAINQHNFAKNAGLRLMESVQNLKMLPCTILHQDTTMMTVKACNDPEIADLLAYISNCKTINIFFHPNKTNLKRFRITTRFGKYHHEP